MKSLKPIRVSRESIQERGMVDDKGKREELLSPMARMFHEPDNSVYIITTLGFKTQLDHDVIKANLVHSFLPHPRFSSLQVVDENDGGKIKWVPTDVDLDNHVIVPILGKNNIKSPEKFVEDYIHNMTKTPISMSMPMWDLHLLNLKTCDAESTAILRVHHSIGDGLSLMSFFLSCTRKLSAPEALTAIPITKKHDSKNRNKFLEYCVKLWPMLLIFWNTIVDVVLLLATALFLDDTLTPLKGPSRVGSNTPRRIVHRIVSLDDVKFVKNAMNVTINDVMVGVAQAGLSQYLNRKYGEGKNEKKAADKFDFLPKNIRLRATLFMNTRAAPGIQALSDMMKKGTKARWGNEVGYVLFPFKIAIKDDPLDYVRDAKAAMDRKKASLEASCSSFMAKFFLNVCGFKGVSFPSQTTLWFSNVPGPREEVSYLGNPVAYIAPSCCGQPNALMIHVVSYCNKMTFIVSVADTIIPDPHQLCDDLEESLNLIKAAAAIADKKG